MTLGPDTNIVGAVVDRIVAHSPKQLSWLSQSIECYDLPGVKRSGWAHRVIRQQPVFWILHGMLVLSPKH